MRGIGSEPKSIVFSSNFIALQKTRIFESGKEESRKRGSSRK
jgi:hypothetical protein